MDDPVTIVVVLALGFVGGMLTGAALDWLKQRRLRREIATISKEILARRRRPPDYFP